jgi:hypothetical protein
MLQVDLRDSEKRRSDGAHKHRFRSMGLRFHPEATRPTGLLDGHRLRDSLEETRQVSVRVGHGRLTDDPRIQAGDP